MPLVKTVQADDSQLEQKAKFKLARKGSTCFKEDVSDCYKCFDSAQHSAAPSVQVEN